MVEGKQAKFSSEGSSKVTFSSDSSSGSSKVTFSSDGSSGSSTVNKA